MNSPIGNFISVIRVAMLLSITSIIFLVCAIILLTTHKSLKKQIDLNAAPHLIKDLWHAPDTLSIANDEIGTQIKYGKELIVHTARYLGPKGSVLQISNGMNCQNCHLEAGTKPFGNNYGSVASLYPKYRARSGNLESIEKRVNDCIERSLNGQAIDSLSKEMRAIVAYIMWIGKDVPIGEKAKGSGLIDITYLPRQADSVKGKILYKSTCSSCHGENGEGVKRFNGVDYVYPPVWGANSFNVGAGLYRISNFSKYIRSNMPLGATYKNPTLTEEDAWDIAAYVVSLPRPEKLFLTDWPKLETKPVDHPIGPYADTFNVAQHKYGPFIPILKSLK